MKKTLLTLALVAAGVVSGFSQGTISFKNSSTTLVQINTNGTPFSAAAGSLTIGLYGREAGASSNTLVLLATSTMNSAPGRFNGPIATNTFITPAGGNGTFQVRAWSGAFATYEAAFAAAQAGDQTILVGASTVWTEDTADPGLPTDNAPLMYQFGFTGVQVTTITPEPGTIALGVLGVGSLLALRRRKS